MAHRSEFPSVHELLPGEGQLHARIVTSLGELSFRLYEDECPKTVANFVGLAQGSLPWVDPRSGEAGEGSYYAGTEIHRVIAGFIVQGGDPTGTGRGGPGYTFNDECVEPLSAQARHEAAGRLSMVNQGRRGPHGTNGGQFFVTLAAAPHLDGKHTVFGELVQGGEVLKQIGAVQSDREDRPLSPLVIKELLVQRSVN